MVSIHISGGISGTVESARQAKEQLAERTGRDRVTVIDSERACGRDGADGAGRRAGGAGRRIAGGRAGPVEEARASLKMWFAVDTLEYLRRGGGSGRRRRGSARR